MPVFGRGVSRNRNVAGNSDDFPLKAVAGEGIQAGTNERPVGTNRGDLGTNQGEVGTISPRVVTPERP